MKIGIIAYHMVPHTVQWGASQRMHFLANQLVDNGFDVTLFHASFGLHESYALSSKYKSFVSYISPSVFQEIQSRMQDAHEVASPSISGRTFLGTIFVRVLRPILMVLYRLFDRFVFNDFNRIGVLAFFWNLSVAKRIKSIHDSEAFDLFIISGPYFTNFRLLSFLKGKLSVPVFLDYRDPWNLLRNGSFHTRLLEKRLCAEADQLVFFSDRFRSDMISRFELDPDKCLTVYNGFDKAAWSDIPFIPLHLRPRINEKFVISYVSSSISLDPSSGRDPSNLIRAISSSRLAQFFHLNLVGCDSVHHAGSYLGSLDLSAKAYGPVDHLQSLSILSNSHLVVVLSTDAHPSKYTLTGKIFDCIKSGAVILGISNEKIAFTDFIIKNNLGFTSSNCQQQIEDMLYDALALLNSLPSSSIGLVQDSSDPEFFRDVDTYSRSFQNQKLIDTIDSFLK